MISTKHTLFLSVLFNFLTACSAQSQTADTKVHLKDLLVAIREQTISVDDAKKDFAEIVLRLRKKYPHGVLDEDNMPMTFPLKGKNHKAVGGKGTGFYARQFDLFDHSISKSHPAHDIFIYDLNRDSREDQSGEFIDLVAVNDGVVIATETNWQDGDEFKGGNYVWMYDFTNGGLWYYAHMRKVFVVEGQLVKGGDKLGEVGRSGFNADNRRSDTHVHLMFLKIDENGFPTPVNHYPWLKSAKTVYSTQLPTDFPRKDFKISYYPKIKKVTPLVTHLPSSFFRINEISWKRIGR